MADLLETIEDGVAILTLNRPERLNAFSPDMLSGMREALPRLAADDSVGAIVITGSGRGFTAGGDVKTMATRAQGQTFEQRLEGYRTMHQIPLMMRSLPKVIIGMVNGPAVGAGLGMALACDLRIAGKRSASGFATGFANRRLLRRFRRVVVADAGWSAPRKLANCITSTRCWTQSKRRHWVWSTVWWTTLTLRDEKH